MNGLHFHYQFIWFNIRPAQNQFTGDYLDRYTDRNKLTVVIERSFNYTIVSTLKSDFHALLEPNLQFDPPRFGAQERWYWMAQTGTQEQPVLYRSEGAELPFTGDDGKDDLEANAEIYFDVRSYFFYCLFFYDTLKITPSWNVSGEPLELRLLVVEHLGILSK